MTKSVIRYGLLAKTESVYGVDAVPTPEANGIRPEARPIFDFNFLNSGELGRAPGTGGRFPLNRPSGEEGGSNVLLTAHGLGRPYTAVVYRPPMHTVFEAAGLEGTFNAGSWTYEPLVDPNDMKSATFYFYEREQLYKGLGSYVANLLFSFDATDIPAWEADILSVFPEVTDTDIPVITYPGAELPSPKAIDVSLSLNGETDLVMRSCDFQMLRNIAPRANDNSSGHQGFAIGARETTLSISVEASPLSDLDPYSLWRSGTRFPVSFTVGKDRYNRWAFRADQAQIINITEADVNESLAVWNLDMALLPSSYTTADEFTLEFD